MFKKIFFLFIFAVLLSFIIFLAYKIIRFTINYKPEPFEYDNNLRTYNFEIINRFLSRLGYKAKIKNFPYKKEKYNIIFLNIMPDDSSLAEWKKWINKGKRLVIFFSNSYMVNDNSVNNKDYFDYKELNVRNKDYLLKDVEKIYLNKNYYIDIYDNKIPAKNLTPVFKINNEIYIGREKYNEGEIIYISDYSIFSDYSILKGSNTVFLNNLVKDYINEEIIFDDVYADKETKAPKLPYFLFTGNFKFLFFQLILISFILFLTFIKRFGPALDKEKFERRSLMRHLEASGYFFEKAKSVFVITKIFDRYFLFRLKKILKVTYSSRNDIFNEVNRRYGLTKEEIELFSFDNKNNIALRETQREKFIRKLKGI